MLRIEIRCGTRFKMDNDIKLVTLVKQYECIYTRYINDNKNKELLENTWKTIAGQMNTSINDCKRRWCVLRNRYAKERREETVDPKGKEWPLMGIMSFLQQYVKRRRTYKEVQEYLTDISSGSTPAPRKIRRIAVESSLHSIIQIEKHELDPLPSTSYSSMGEASAIIKIEEREEDGIETCASGTIGVTDWETEESCSLKNSVQLNETRVNPTKNDPDMRFCLSLYQSLQNMSKTCRNKVKIDILDVVDKYETSN